MPGRIPDDIRDAIAERIRTSEQPRRNEIAREFGVSVGTVTNISREIGRDFDRTPTEKATKARAADINEGVSTLADRMVKEAHALLDTLHSPYLVYNFGGRDNTYAQHTLAEPPIEAKRQIMTIAAIAIDKVLKVRQETKGDGASLSAFGQFLALMAGADREGVDYASE